MQRPELGTAHWECQSSRLVWRRCCRLPLCLIPCRLLVGSGANCSCLFWFLRRSAQKVEFSALRPELWISESSASRSDFSSCLIWALPFHFVLLRTESGALYMVVKLSVTELYQFMNCYCSSVCSPVARSVGSLSRASSAVVANLHLFLIKAYLLGKKEGYSKLKRFVPGCSLISFICWFRLSSLLFLVHAHHHCEPLCLLCSHAYSQLWQNSLI